MIYTLHAAWMFPAKAVPVAIRPNCQERTPQIFTCGGRQEDRRHPSWFFPSFLGGAILLYCVIGTVLGETRGWPMCLGEESQGHSGNASAAMKRNLPEEFTNSMDEAKRD
jgi:hypothetical protein